MTRAYLSAVIGTGTPEDPYRPAAVDEAPGLPWRATDGRPLGEVAGEMLVEIDGVSEAQHAAILDGGATHVADY